MKEARFFYVPNASVGNELPDEEALHAVTEYFSTCRNKRHGKA